MGGTGATAEVTSLSNSSASVFWGTKNTISFLPRPPPKFDPSLKTKKFIGKQVFSVLDVSQAVCNRSFSKPLQVSWLSSKLCPSLAQKGKARITSNTTLDNVTVQELAHLKTADRQLVTDQKPFPRPRRKV